MDFQEQVTRFAAKTGIKMEKVARASIINLFSKIVVGTPVDTGRARANWQLELDAAPENASLNEKDKQGGKTVAKGHAKLEELDYTTRMACIRNNVDYIVKLEYGGSKQAPNGMVRLNVADWPQIVAAITKRLA